jgi:hypothetical protein
MKPIRRGRIWYVRCPGTIQFQPFLTRAAARAWIKRQKARP